MLFIQINASIEISFDSLSHTYHPFCYSCSVEIVEVHVDAVLEIPYYTIQLPNKMRKKTSWDNLMTLAEYKKSKSTSSPRTDHDSKTGDGNSRRSRSLSRLTSRLRGSSSQRQLGQDRQRQRSISRNNRLRSSSNGRDRGDNHSMTSASSRRSQSPYKSSRSHSSSRRSSSRRCGEHLGRSNSSQRGNHDRSVCRGCRHHPGHGRPTHQFAAIGQPVDRVRHHRPAAGRGRADPGTPAAPDQGLAGQPGRLGVT